MRGEVVHLIRAGAVQSLHHRGRVQEVAPDYLDAREDAIETIGRLG
jgi:hypothetical protein